MDYSRIASRVVEARKKKSRKTPKILKNPVETVSSPSESVLEPSTEYSCRMEISLSADFEGDVVKKDLIKKLKSEVIASIKSGMEQVSRDLGIRGTGVVIKPLQVECVANSVATGDDALFEDV